MQNNRKEYRRKPFSLSWGLVEAPRGTVKLNYEGYFSFEVGVDKTVAVDNSLIVEFNEDNSEGNRGHSILDECWRS